MLCVEGQIADMNDTLSDFLVKFACYFGVITNIYVQLYLASPVPLAC